MESAYRHRPGDLERKLAAAFPDESDRAAARRLLDSYGDADHHREADRVRLAVLKIAGGDLEAVAAHVALANVDFRDVLAIAEYPAYRRLPPGVDQKSPQARAALAADAAQYREWVDG